MLLQTLLGPHRIGNLHQRTNLPEMQNWARLVHEAFGRGRSMVLLEQAQMPRVHCHSQIHEIANR